MRLTSVCLLPLFLLLLATPGLAQGVQTGILRGIVTDPQDLPVPGVTVTIASPAMQLPRSAVTDEHGAYVFGLLPAGEYRVQFELGGFEPLDGSVTVPLGGSATQDATLRPAAVAETLNVVASAPPLAEPAVEFNIRREEVEALATSPTIQGITTLAPGVSEAAPNAGQVSIHGAFGFDNIFMLNGVDINDNLFGDPQALFIEEAIEETQVISSGATAEFGRFSGGVVNAITQSGGNAFSGSLRLNLTNPAWADETPFEKENDISHPSEVNDTYEGTFGGPVVRDRIWFFFAGRLANLSNSETFGQTGIPYLERDENFRGEGKGTVSPAAGQTVQVGYLTNRRELENSPSFPSFSIDPRTLVSPRVPNWYTFANYRGVLTPNLLAEGQFSERRYTVEGSGGTSRTIADSPFITLTQELAHYNAPYFDATDPEERNNRQLTGNATYFLDGAGRHELKGGLEWFRSQNTGGNSQSSTSYVFDADYATDANGDPLLDAQGRLVPQFVPFGATTPAGDPLSPTVLEHWIATRGAVLNVDTTSVFVQDRWTITPHVTANLGLRYERVRSEATGGIVGVDTDTIVPRLGLTYDVNGDGAFVLGTTYGHYSGRYNEAQISSNSNVGNPDRTFALYIGDRGQGIDFAPGLDPANYVIVQGIFPTAHVFFEDGLSSAVVREFTASAGAAAGARAYAEATYVWRQTTDVIEDFVDLSNGTSLVDHQGTEFEFTNIVYRNSDLPERRYQAAVFQARLRARDDWTFHGAWTLQLQNEGNYVGEASNQPAIPSMLGDFPEAFTEERHFPTGRLPTFQRHRARLWTIYTLGMERFGDLSLSGLWRIESGTPYSYVATGLDLTPTQLALLADYPDAPFTQNVYFGERGSETYPGHALVDVSLNYNVPVFRSLRPWVKFDVFNLLDNDKVVGFNTTVLPDPASPADALGLPTGFIRGPNFGQPTGPGDYPSSLSVNGGRLFRVAAGFRF